MILWVKNTIKLVNSCLLIIKALKMQDGCQISHQQNVLATDVPFSLMLLNWLKPETTIYSIVVSAKTNCFWLLRNILVTKYDVISWILVRHDLSEAIYKMLAVRNDKKPSLGVAKLGF